MQPGSLSFIPFFPVARSLPLGFSKSSITKRCRDWRRPLCVAESFEEAIDSGFVRDFGQIVNLDSDGCFPLGSKLQIPDTLRRPLQDAVGVVRRVVGCGGVRAIYLRGSVVTGNFMTNGRSDLDLVVVTRRPISRVKRILVNAAVSDVVKDTLGLSGADIRYMREASTWFGTDDSDATPNMHVLLRNYSVLLYGVATAVGVQDTTDKPTGDLALNIRNEERSFLRLFHKGTKAKDFQIQVDAIQWMCKRSLRAIADLSSIRTNQHSRDLVPCYRLAVNAFPDHARTWLFGLQFACASTDNRYLGLSKSEFLGMGCNIARDMVEVVEELYLSCSFGVFHPSQSQLCSTTSSELFPSHCLTDEITEFVTETLATLTLALNPRRLRLEELTFRRNELPIIPLTISPLNENVEMRQDRIISPTWCLLTQNCLKVSSPYIVRNAHFSNESFSVDTESILEELLRTTLSVQCRVSPVNEFTFCRRSHPWIEANAFSPPSVLSSVRVEDAILRMCEDCPFPPLFYTESSQESIYIQTEVSQSQRVFTGLEMSNLRIAQQERMWISTHGSVSGMHFDSSHSALLQRTGSKRMLFFAPECLEYLGIYPLGHPLHRRSRVNLTRPESQLFQEFWKVCSSQAIEVILEKGDMVVFPPFWTHYTESIASNPKELSISHTLRFM